METAAEQRKRQEAAFRGRESSRSFDPTPEALERAPQGFSRTPATSKQKRRLTRKIQFIDEVSGRIVRSKIEKGPDFEKRVQAKKDSVARREIEHRIGRGQAVPEYLLIKYGFTKKANVVLKTAQTNEARKRVGQVTRVVERRNSRTFVGATGRKYTVPRLGLKFTAREKPGGLISKEIAEQEAQKRKAFRAQKKGQKILESLSSRMKGTDKGKITDDTVFYRGKIPEKAALKPLKFKQLTRVEQRKIILGEDKVFNMLPGKKREEKESILKSAQRKYVKSIDKRLLNSANVTDYLNRQKRLNGKLTAKERSALLVSGYSYVGLKAYGALTVPFVDPWGTLKSMARFGIDIGKTIIKRKPTGTVTQLIGQFAKDPVGTSIEMYVSMMVFSLLGKGIGLAVRPLAKTRVGLNYARYSAALSNKLIRAGSKFKGIRPIREIVKAAEILKKKGRNKIIIKRVESRLQKIQRKIKTSRSTKTKAKLQVKLEKEFGKRLKASVEKVKISKKKPYSKKTITKLQKLQEKARRIRDPVLRKRIERSIEREFGRRLKTSLKRSKAEKKISSIIKQTKLQRLQFRLLRETNLKKRNILERRIEIELKRRLKESIKRSKKEKIKVIKEKLSKLQRLQLKIRLEKNPKKKAILERKLEKEFGKRLRESLKKIKKEKSTLKKLTKVKLTKLQRLQNLLRKEKDPKKKLILEKGIEREFGKRVIKSIKLAKEKVKERPMQKISKLEELNIKTLKEKNPIKKRILEEQLKKEFIRRYKKSISRLPKSEREKVVNINFIKRRLRTTIKSRKKRSLKEIKERAKKEPTTEEQISIIARKRALKLEKERRLLRKQQASEKKALVGKQMKAKRGLTKKQRKKLRLELRIAKKRGLIEESDFIKNVDVFIRSINKGKKTLPQRIIIQKNLQKISIKLKSQFKRTKSTPIKKQLQKVEKAIEKEVSNNSRQTQVLLLEKEKPLIKKAKQFEQKLKTETKSKNIQKIATETKILESQFKKLAELSKEVKLTNLANRFTMLGIRMSKIAQKQLTKAKVTQKPIAIVKALQKQKQELKQSISEVQGQAVSQSQAQAISQAQSVSQSISQMIGQLQAQSVSQSMLKSATKLIQTGKKIRIPKIPIITWDTKLRKGYVPLANIIVRVRGKNREIKLRTTPNRALRYIINKVDTTTARSFQIKIVGVRKGKDIGKISLKKFRPRRGIDKRVLRFVEKSKHAIDTRGEKTGLKISKLIKKRR